MGVHSTPSRGVRVADGAAFHRRMPSLPQLLTRRDCDPSWLSRAHRRGRLVLVLPGVFLRPDVATDPTWLARAAIAWRPGVVIGGEYAASLTFWRELDVTAIDVVTRTTLVRPGFRFSDRTIPRDAVGSYGYFQITMPALTALDLVLTHGPDTIDRALRSRLVRIGDLYAALAATPSRDGNRDRRRLLLDSRTEPWSAAERLAHAVLTEAGIPGWVANKPLLLDGQRYWLDVAFAGLKLALEIDGYEFHSEREVFESDRERHNSLQLAGWTVLHFTWRQLHERPDYVIETVKRGIRYARRLQRLQRQARTAVLPSGATT